MEVKNEENGFKLQNQTDAFSARRESIFGNIPVAKLTHKELISFSGNTEDHDAEEETSRNEDVTLYKGEESMFKRPMPKLRKSSHPPPRRQLKQANKFRVPDHKKNPHKWVKYNLATTAEVTEKSNSAAAFSFLRELEERKRKHDECDEPTQDNNDGKIVFKKPKASEAESKKGKTYRDGKLCMPAFEFGSQRPKESKKQVTTEKKTSKSTTQRPLSHLNEVDEEEEG